MRISVILIGGVALAAAGPALAQDETAPAPLVSVSGGATLTSDYRFRGLSRSNEVPAVQGTITASHASGLYAGAWASTVDGGCDAATLLLTCHGGAEVDLYGGFSRIFDGVGVDAGITYYLYPGGARGARTDFFEPYASISYTLGPATAKAGLAYAWGGQGALDFATRRSDDSLYLYGEGSIGVPRTPFTLRAHVGRTDGALGRVNINPANDSYWDWSLTAEAVFRGRFRAGISYVDTSVTDALDFNDRLGRDATILGYVGVTF